MYQHPQENASQEPDLYYFVPRSQGHNGKPVVRARPQPPPSISAPLDDNFDATTTRGARTEVEGPTHRLERPKSPSPPAHNHNVATITKKAVPPRSPSAPKHQPATAVATITPRRMDNARPTVNINGNHEKAPRDSYEVYGDYGRYINELEREFGGSPDLTLSPSRSRKEQGSSGVAMKAAPPANANNANANMGNNRIGLPARLGSIPRPGAPGPRPRQSFEMVERRVLEDGPERTVTISTWREQVADEADDRANMDVYYLDEHAYAGEVEDGDDGVDEDRDERTSITETDGLVVRQKRSLPATPSQEGTESNLGSIRTITDEQSESSPASVKRTVSSVHTTHKSSGSSSQSQLRRSSGTSSSQPGGWHPTPPLTPPPPPAQRSLSPPLHRTTAYGASSSALGGKTSDSHERSAVTRTPDHTAMRPNNQPAPRSSTPNRTYVRDSGPSFHPTQSGSTISTIKSASTIALEKILDSCEPSLLHVAPALAGLGILNDGHLRAISRLSDETRNRELKDAALKQGITVMEWAILLDKLQTV